MLSVALLEQTNAKPKVATIEYAERISSDRDSTMIESRRSPSEKMINPTVGKLEALISKALGDRDIHISEIPELDLYIDQILTLVSLKNEIASDRYRDNTLTKTMINIF